MLLYYIHGETPQGLVEVGCLFYYEQVNYALKSVVQLQIFIIYIFLFTLHAKTLFMDTGEFTDH